MRHAVSFKLLEDVAKDLSTGEITFPTFLDITFQVRTALKDPKISIEQISRLVSAEPMMSTKIIKMANSVAINPYGNVVADVKTAIGRVGMEAVRIASFAVAMEQLVRSRQMQPFVEMSRRLWEHTVLASALCRVLARKVAKINADEAMFAGLVHDIGAFYLMSRAANFPEFVDSPDELNDLLVSWHEDIGHALLSALSLPEKTLNAVRNHESHREIVEIRTISDVLYVANKIANRDAPWCDKLQEDDVSMISDLLDEESLAEIISESQEEVQSLKSALEGG